MSYKLTVNVPTNISLNKEQAKQITIQYIADMYTEQFRSDKDISNSNFKYLSYNELYIKGENLVIEYNAGHGSDIVEVVRKAKPCDFEFFNLIEKIRNS